jgi:hypothetical protein
MTDIRGFGLYIGTVFLKILLAPVLFVWSFILVIKQKRLGDWFRQVCIGWDIAANKAFEPVLNDKLRKPGCPLKYGNDTTISHDMADIKVIGYQNELGDNIEKIINKIDNNHLEKTLKNYEERNRSSNS